MSSNMNVIIIFGSIAIFVVGFYLGWQLCNRHRARRPHGGRSHRQVMPNDITALLSSPGRDFLIRNNGNKVNIKSLEGKKLGLYFSASHCSPSQQFTTTLIEAYNQLRTKVDFEIVWVPSGERDEPSFVKYFSNMPWLAIPYPDSDKSDILTELFGVIGIPRLVMLDEARNVITDRAVGIIREYGADAYPFTEERIRELKAQEDEIRQNQSLTSLLVHDSRDFVISSKGNKVPISELEGNMVGLYFTIPSCAESSGADFTPKLINFYNEVTKPANKNGTGFEVVWVPLDTDNPSFDKTSAAMPWLSLPPEDNKTSEKLYRYFDLTRVPTLVIIGANGGTLHVDAAGVVEEHGVAAFPFDVEKLCELEKKKVQGLPKKLRHALHGEHDVVLTRRSTYVCDFCVEQGLDWSYCCQECDFDLHPTCASSS